MAQIAKVGVGSTVNSQPSTVNRQKLTVNSQQSTVNRQQSTVNDLNIPSFLFTL